MKWGFCRARSVVLACGVGCIAMLQACAAKGRGDATVVVVEGGGSIVAGSVEVNATGTRITANGLRACPGPGCRIAGGEITVFVDDNGDGKPQDDEVTERYTIPSGPVGGCVDLGTMTLVLGELGPPPSIIGHLDVCCEENCDEPVVRKFYKKIPRSAFHQD